MGYSASFDYGRDYYERRSKDHRRAIAYAQEYERVCKRVEGGALLDVGCGTGEFTALFPAEKWDRYGIDISGYAKMAARSRGIEITCHDCIDDESLDLVIFRGTLQHIQEIFDLLILTTKLLRPGGLLAILAQPDADSLCYRLFHELPALDPKRNWWIPGRYELRNILVNLGYSEIEFSWPYRGGPYARPLRDFVCFILRLFGIRKPFAFPGNMMEVYARRG